MSRPRRSGAFLWRGAAIAAVITVGLIAGYVELRDAALVEAIEGQTLSWRFRLRGPVEPPPSVAIVAIDDRTVTALKRWPVSRGVLAEAVGKLQEAGAAAIGLDLLLLDKEQPTDGVALSPGDRALLDALRDSPESVLALAFTFGAGTTLDAETEATIRRSAYRVVVRPADGAEKTLLRATGALVPIAPLREAVGLGHVNVPVSTDGTLRALPLGIALGDVYIPALPVEAARRLLGLDPGEVALELGRGVRLGDRTLPADTRTRIIMNFYGPPGTIPTYPLIDLLEGRIPAGALAGRAVLVGSTAIGVGDTFAAPFSRSTPGVEILATAVANLAAGDPIDAGARIDAVNLAAILALGALCFALSAALSPGASAVASLALLAAWAIAAQIALAERTLWLDLTFPSAAILLNALALGLVRTVTERGLRRNVERERSNLARYHSPVIADMLAASERPSFDERRQDAAILFADLSGYTQRSEHMDPAEAVAFLRQFHRRLERAVLAHGGVLEQFLGDGAMVIFGVPSPDRSDAASALACARALAEDMMQWSAELEAAGQPPLTLRIGVHYGPVVIAGIGGETQVHMTATGDTVNVASRLEALTRDHDATVAVSGALAEAVAGLGRADLLAGFIELPAQAIRGRDEHLSVWIAGRTRPAEPHRAP